MSIKVKGANIKATNSVELKQVQLMQSVISSIFFLTGFNGNYSSYFKIGKYLTKLCNKSKNM